MKRLLYLALCLLPAAPLFAADPVLSFWENNSKASHLVRPDGSIVNLDGLVFGASVAAGTTIVTEHGDFVELELSNGSIIKIQENTDFTVVAIQGDKSAKRSEFDMKYGRFRAVAAKAAAGQQYQFKTRTAVCGIRGTDLVLESLAGTSGGAPLPAKVFVLSGLVDVTKLDEALKELGSIVLKAGQWADTGAASFAPLAIDPALLESLKQGLEFKKLDPGKVPGQTTAAVGPTAADTGATLPPAEPPEPDWMKTLREIIGLEIGAVTIGNDTYAKAVLAPKFKLDKFKLSLYLPVIYRTNLFDPGDWYKPDGNNEWSFGTDESFGDSWWLRVGDIAYDLVLKIKGLEFGTQRDPFFIKLGNLNTFTVGHGLFMRNYANDSDFPGIRRIGFDLGVDTGPFGFELVSNDLGMAFKAEPEIAGTRIYLRPFHPFALAVGLSFIADFDPAKAAPGVGDPIFLNAGLDLDFPLVKEKDFNVVLFVDSGLMLPYFREDVPGTPVIPAGFAFDAIVYGPDGAKSFKNFGAAAGAIGNVSMFEWRLEARYYTGQFKPAFFNSIYDRVKLDYVNEVIAYLRNPNDAANQTTTFGVYGEGTFSIDKVFSVTLGYLCPLAFGDAGVTYGDDDFFQIKFTLEPKVIPIVGIFGSISYERNKFVSSFAGGFPELFDENTVVRTTIGYPVVEGLQILFHYTTTQAVDPGTGVKSLVHSFTFETVIAF